MPELRLLLGLILLLATASVHACVCDDSNWNCFTSTVFDKCCNRIGLETTGSRVALTAFCPTGYMDSIEQASYLYSRLYLDEIMQFDGSGLDALTNFPSKMASP